MKKFKRLKSQPKKNLTKIKKTKTTKKKPESRNAYLVRRILVMNTITFFVIIATYFIMIFFLSNVGSFWDIFRRKEIYTEQSVFAPLPPYLNPISEATQETSIDITGQSESGQKVALYIDHSKIDETVADSEGTFSFTEIAVGVFPQTLYTRAINEEGVESENSNTYAIVLDKEPPELEVLTPSKSEEYKSTGHVYTVTGKTEPDVTVYVNEQTAVVNPNGDFSTSLRLNEGENEITIIATDKAENTTEEKVFISFSKID